MCSFKELTCIEMLIPCIKSVFSYFSFTNCICISIGFGGNSGFQIIPQTLIAGQTRLMGKEALLLGLVVSAVAFRSGSPEFISSHFLFLFRKEPLFLKV